MRRSGAPTGSFRAPWVSPSLKPAMLPPSFSSSNKETAVFPHEKNERAEEGSAKKAGGGEGGGLRKDENGKLGGKKEGEVEQEEMGRGEGKRGTEDGTRGNANVVGLTEGEFEEEKRTKQGNDKVGLTDGKFEEETRGKIMQEGRGPSGKNQIEEEEENESKFNHLKTGSGVKKTNHAEETGSNVNDLESSGEDEPVGVVNNQVNDAIRINQPSKPAITTTTTMAIQKINGGMVLVRPSSTSFRAPSSTSTNTVGPETSHGQAELDPLTCFTVMYTKRSTKKRKTFSDGVIAIRGLKLTLFDSEGKQVSATRLRGGEAARYGSGSQIDVSSMEVEVVASLNPELYLSGRAFILPGATISSVVVAPPRTAVARPFASVGGGGNSEGKKLGSTLYLSASASNTSEAKSAFNANAPNALILLRGDPIKGTVDIVVDPALTYLLRPHQRDGVQFMFDCVMGHRKHLFNGLGCVLADEMGLGKTLQSITLMWTMMKQGPKGPRDEPYARKCVVVCPASLVGNWSKEVGKFLGPAKLMPIAVMASGAQADKDVDEFITSRVRNMLIISYETYRKHSEQLNKCKGFELLICDEGHRLKSAAGNKTIDALSSAPTLRRIILTGTPLQNKLDEFFSVVSFVNPHALGRDAKQFIRVFQQPIEDGRDNSATREQILIANARSKELAQLTEGFLLRRTSEINNKFLPPKRETTIFVRLTPEQVAKYQAFLQSKQFGSFMQHNAGASKGTDALRLVMRLKQLCTHPALLENNENVEAEVEDDDLISGGPAAASDERRPCLGGIGRAPSPSPFHEIIERSGKFLVLDALLSEIRTRDITDRVVLVSSFTSTLNVVEELMRFRKWRFLRLDGQTPVKDRQKLVNKFNAPATAGLKTTSEEGEDAAPSLFAFLLSSKAGGCGINLIGANRLILIDPDWNPAVDLQAMARIWRDGQKKSVVIYRMLSTGTLEERVFQRQIMKTQTASGVLKSSASAATTAMNQDASGVGFSRSDLKRLFNLRLDTDCDTFDLLGDHGESLKKKPNDSDLAKEGSSVWPQYHGIDDIEDDEPLKATVSRLGNGVVSWVHSTLVTEPKAEDLIVDDDDVEPQVEESEGGVVVMEENERDDDVAEVNGMNISEVSEGTESTLSTTSKKRRIVADDTDSSEEEIRAAPCFEEEEEL